MVGAVAVLVVVGFALFTMMDTDEIHRTAYAPVLFGYR
jgi:hypothetical protein